MEAVAKSDIDWRFLVTAKSVSMALVTLPCKGCSPLATAKCVAVSVLTRSDGDSFFLRLASRVVIVVGLFWSTAKSVATALVTGPVED